MQKPFVSAVALLLLAQPVLAATNPWFGTWKLDRNKSTLTGSTVTITQKGGMYGWTIGPIHYTVGEDGKDYPMVPHYTASLKSTGKNEWLMVSKFDGKETSRSTIKLLSDGKTLEWKTTGTHADGSTYSSEETDERIGSAGTGLAGTWKDTKEDSSSKSTMVYSDGGAGMLKVVYPSAQETDLVPLDGKPVQMSGPRVTNDVTVEYKQVSPTELKYTVTYQGKPLSAGVQTVSSDGKILKDTNWLVSKPDEKTIVMYEKE